MDLGFAGGFMPFAGDFPGKGFTLAGDDLITGLSTFGFGTYAGGLFSGEFEIMDDAGATFLAGSFGLRLEDHVLGGLAGITGGTGAALFGSTALVSFQLPDMPVFGSGVSEVPNSVFMVEAAAAPAPVPLPAALPMLLAALGGLTLMRRRQI